MIQATTYDTHTLLRCNQIEENISYHDPYYKSITELLSDVVNVHS